MGSANSDRRLVTVKDEVSQFCGMDGQHRRVYLRNLFRRKVETLNR